MIAVFSKHNSPRLTFILDFCFKEKGCEYEVITSLEEWDQNDNTKLNYSDLELDCDYSIEPSGVLFEEDIDLHLKLEREGQKVIVRGYKDPLSVMFYILARYEEYQYQQYDVHGRFSAAHSQQKSLGILKEPIVDDIVKKLWLKLGLEYRFVQDRFECVPSFDIDVAWAYKHRPFWRKVGAFSKGRLLERMGVLFFKRKDPYDTYGQILTISTELNRIICFAPVSDYGPRDKNIAWKNEHYRSLLRGLNSAGGMGLHPGYASYMNAEVIQEEKRRLEEILGHEMNKSRFHFLRFQLPESYRLMISLGFTKDYSMGFADDAGFRAGTSFPFHFFDLGTNKPTNYLVFPFAYLDSAFKDYRKIGPDEALEEVSEMMERVRNVGGVFMCIWHNHSISDKGEWKGWLKVLENTVKWGKQ